MKCSALTDALEALDHYILGAIIANDTRYYGLTETYFHLRIFEGPYVSRDLARTILRSLTDRGFCQFRAGLFNDEGMTAGSGYGITRRGLKYWAALEEVRGP